MAVILGPNKFATIFELPPRSLGKITATNATCNLFGWGSVGENPEFNAVTVYSSQYCDKTSPQLSCSTFDSPFNTACSALTGSPLVCDNGFVDGIVLSHEMCTATDESHRLYYLSVGEFREWIEQVSGAELTARLSIPVILSALVISLKVFI